MSREYDHNERMASEYGIVMLNRTDFLIWVIEQDLKFWIRKLLLGIKIRIWIA